jgi:hypothetical protein
MTPLTRYFGALTVLLLFAMVLTRVQLLRSRGITAMRFGEIDKTDFLIPTHIRANKRALSVRDAANALESTMPEPLAALLRAPAQI